MGNENIHVLQIGISLFYKLWRLGFIKNKEKIVTNCDSYIITNWGNCYYEMGQSLQIRTIVITK